MTRVVLFRPGDERALPNELASESVDAFTRQLERAVIRLGHTPTTIEGFLTSPADAIETLSGIDEPVIGVFAHWVYAPHTTDGVAGSDAPLLLASNFDGTWPGLVGLLNTGASLTSLGRRHGRIWSSAPDVSDDTSFLEPGAAMALG